MDLGEMLDKADRLDYSGRLEDITNTDVLPQYRQDKFAVADRAMIYVDPVLEGSKPGTGFSINERFTYAINNREVGPVIWVTSEALDFLSRMYFNGQTLRGQWSDPRAKEIGRISIAWVEDNRDPEKGSGGIRFEIQGYQDFVWMIDHSNPKENFDRDFSAWKAEWRD